ncbi:hypothetical protein [Clostridium sp. 'White wine YQ']|uniref:hypothetical protein n=1 Tax=Clostridium sp. 'White wine YQ' TaxID=3027474 RepID=UPI002367365A|nr:hypothetical protein [Clostridium sp. 'White wine YQ']MDD7793062.1 hypothetical protein [Clostridium sp. 'White wine YQ']
MNNKNVGYSIVTVSVLLITQLIIRSVGIENISAQVFVALLVIACSLAIFGTYKDGKKGFGIRYNCHDIVNFSKHINVCYSDNI